MTLELDQSLQFERDTPAYYAECARRLRVDKGEMALPFAISMVQFAIEAKDERACEAWSTIAEVLCKEEDRAPFGSSGWIKT